MTTIEIANRLVELCRDGKGDEILDTLYSKDAVSVEAMTAPGMEREARGVEAIRAKGVWWVNNHDVHAFDITGPWPHDDRFIVGFSIDVTFKPTGERTKMQEAGLYTVAGGKIVREEFFYSA
ncbi:MAG: SnoaL-like domain-containing protein [Burkholderiales bacterium]